MFHASTVRFDVMENLVKFWVFGCIASSTVYHSSLAFVLFGKKGKNHSSNGFANGFAILVNLAFERLPLAYLGVGFWIGKRLRPVFLRQFRAWPGLFGAVSFVGGSPCAK